MGQETPPWSPMVQKVMVSAVRENLERVLNQLQAIHNSVPDEHKPLYASALSELDAQYELRKARQREL